MLENVTARILTQKEVKYLNVASTIKWRKPW